MLIDHINLNTLRIFESVFRTRSMTKAATELHLTQSGVSQHIKHLEEVLETKLFDRVKQRLIPTKDAEVLFDKCSPSLYAIEESLAQIKNSDEFLKGVISIGLPIEFGNSMILPILCEIGKRMPLIDFQIKYGYASEFNEEILKGNLDFAIVDEFKMDSQITVKEIFQEVHILCASDEYIKAKGDVGVDKKYFESLDYISYLPDAPVIKNWFQHNYKFQRLNLPVRARAMDVEGVATMISGSLGVGILPEHFVNKFEKEKNISFYKFNQSGAEVENPLSLAYLEGRIQSPVIKAVLDSLMEELKVLAD